MKHRHLFLVHILDGNSRKCFYFLLNTHSVGGLFVTKMSIVAKYFVTYFKFIKDGMVFSYRCLQIVIIAPTFSNSAEYNTNNWKHIFIFEFFFPSCWLSQFFTWNFYFDLFWQNAKSNCAMCLLQAFLWHKLMICFNSWYSVTPNVDAYCTIYTIMHKIHCFFQWTR